MIRIYYGDDRVKAKQEIVKVLGNDYEVIDAGELTEMDLPTIFKGGSLFTDKRKIMIRDLLSNKVVSDKVVDYVDTTHEIVLFESKLDKRSVAYKSLKDKVEMREFPLKQNADFGVVFDVYRTAKRDGKRAVEMLRTIEQNEEPIMFTGLIVSQALKDFAARPGAKEKRVLVELSKVDMQMKTTATKPWLLVESFLLRLEKL